MLCLTEVANYLSPRGGVASPPPVTPLFSSGGLACLTHGLMGAGEFHPLTAQWLLRSCTLKFENVPGRSPIHGLTFAFAAAFE